MPAWYYPAAVQEELVGFLDAGAKSAVVTYGSMFAGFKVGTVKRIV